MRQLDALRATITLAERRRMIDHDRDLPTDCQFTHLCTMLTVIEHDPSAFSPAKLGRWLGWAQACVVAAGVATLNDMKQINLDHSDDD